MATKKASATTARERTSAAATRNPQVDKSIKAMDRALKRSAKRGPGIVPGNGGLDPPSGDLTGRSPRVKANVQKVVRNSGSGRFADKGSAKTDPKGTQTETVKRKPRKAKVIEEPRFVLVSVDHLSAGNDLTGMYPEPMTKGEMMATLAKEFEDMPIQERQGKSVPFAIPENFGAVADLLYTTRKERLSYTHRADALKIHETALKDHLINNLPKKDSTGAAGKIARASIVQEDVPVVEDWTAFHAHIKKTGQFDLLNRALNRSAAKERIRIGKKIPGMGTFKATKVSVEKVGGGK